MTGNTRPLRWPQNWPALAHSVHILYIGVCAADVKPGLLDDADVHHVSQSAIVFYSMIVDTFEKRYVDVVEFYGKRKPLEVFDEAYADDAPILGHSAKLRRQERQQTFAMATNMREQRQH